MSRFLILLFVVCCWIALLGDAAGVHATTGTASTTSKEPTVYQRYFALMQKKKELDDLERNSALIQLSSTGDDWDLITSNIKKQYNTLLSGLVKNGAESFKSCADVNNQRLNIYGKSKLDDGIYIIFIEKKATLVYCDMTSMDGGFTLIRRVSTPKWWPLDDNFSGVGYGNYDANDAFVPNVVFGLDYSKIPRSRFLFKTGDAVHWVLVDEKAILANSFSDHDSVTETEVLASSKYPHETKKTVWCKRKGRPEDPWISIEAHNFHDLSAVSDSEEHSMLWGENNVSGWNYWKNNHNGINVFIR